MLHLNLGELGLAKHDFGLARSSYERAKELITKSSPHYFEDLATGGLGLCHLMEGDLTTARKCETSITLLPDFWSFDPTILTIFRARMSLKRQDLGRAWKVLQQARDNVKGRLVPAWLRLEEGLEVAETIGVADFVRRFQGLKDRYSEETR